MDSFRHTHRVIITSFTYQLALNLVSRARVIPTWKHKASRKSKTALTTSLILDTITMSCQHPLACEHTWSSYSRYVLDNAGIWEAHLCCLFWMTITLLLTPASRVQSVWEHSRKISPCKGYAIPHRKLADISSIIGILLDHPMKYGSLQLLLPWFHKFKPCFPVVNGRSCHQVRDLTQWLEYYNSTYGRWLR